MELNQCVVKSYMSLVIEYEKLRMCSIVEMLLKVEELNVLGIIYR